jgi:hypothetical protein
MTAMLKYLVEHFERTGYEPWVDVLLFVLFASAVLAAVWRLLGRAAQGRIKRGLLLAAAKYRSECKGGAPGWEAFRSWVAPYLELVSSILWALVGIFSAAIVSVALIYGHVPRRAVPLGVSLILVSLWYMGKNFEWASWAYHRIKERRKGAGGVGKNLERIEKIEMAGGVVLDGAGVVGMGVRG